MVHQDVRSIHIWQLITSPTGSELKLVGILRSDTAGARGYVPMNIGQELFLLEDGVSGIEIELVDPDRAPEIAE